jgi:hypothetical protein
MSEIIKSIYDQVLAVANARREASQNTKWEEFKANRVDPVVQRLQNQVRAARPKHGFGGAFA